MADEDKLEAIFAAALPLEEKERAAYLRGACGEDDQLRQRVEALIRASSDAGSFLDQPPAEFIPTLAGGHYETADEKSGDVPLDFLQPCDKPGSIGAIGTYQVLDVVGRGGMGLVLRAFDTKLNRIVAIKVMAPDLAASPMAVKRFLREARAAAAVSHDHVVTIHAIEESNRPPFIVMEYVDGQSLQDKIERCGDLELNEILRIGMQMAGGLAAAHQQGLVHRDIKPANILLENGVERVKLTDFGLARTVDDVSVTQPGLIAGTPQFMSPEQAQGFAVDARSDLFSLGSVLYTMCVGRPPFRGESAVAMLRQVTDETPRPIREVNGDIPPWLETIVFKLMAKDPDQRIQTAEQVANLLGGHLAHLQHPTTIPAPPDITSLQADAAGSIPEDSDLGPPPLPSVRRFVIVAILAALAGVLIFRLDEIPGWSNDLAFPTVMVPFLILLAIQHRKSPTSRAWRALVVEIAVASLLSGVAYNVMRRDLGHQETYELMLSLWLGGGVLALCLQMGMNRFYSLLTAAPRRWIDRSVRLTTALALVVLIAGTFLVHHPFGRLRVEIQDTQTEVTVDGHSLMVRQDVVTGESGTFTVYDHDRSVELRTGEKRLRIRHGDLSFETEAFRLSGGEDKKATVEIVDDRIQVKLGDKVIGRRFMTGDAGITLFSVSAAGELMRIEVRQDTVESELLHRLGESFQNVEALTAAGDGTLYAVVGNEDDSDVLYRIDVDGAQEIGPVGFSEVDGLAWRQGQLLAVTSKLGGENSRLLQINPATGEARQLANLSLLNDLDSLTFDDRGRLITTDGSGLKDKFYQLDYKRTAPPLPLCETPPIIKHSRDIEGLAMAPDGMLYGITHPSPKKGVGPDRSYLVRVDPYSFQYENLGLLDFPAFCLAADPKLKPAK